MSTDITIYRAPERMTLDQNIAAWLDEKRADSERTASAYEATSKELRSILSGAGLDLDSEPALVAPPRLYPAVERVGTTAEPLGLSYRESQVLVYIHPTMCCPVPQSAWEVALSDTQR